MRLRCAYVRDAVHAAAHVSVGAHVFAGSRTCMRA